MTKNYGIKISRPGYDVFTANPDELVFSSKYTSLRVRLQGSGTILDSTGRTITIPHNLGYVPYFLVHATPDPTLSGFYDTGDFFIPPIVPVVAGACHLERQIYAYADNTNLYIKVGADLGYKFFSTGAVGFSPTSTDYARSYGGEWEGSGTFKIGRKESKNYEGAMRFINVGLAKNQGIVSATWIINGVNVTGNQTIRHRLYGIDEDNTANFSDNPFGRSKTTASDNFGYTCGSAPATINVGVTGIVQEIIGRNGWSSGNAMGFILKAEGTNSDNNTYITTTSGEDNNFYCSGSSLRILLSDTLASYKYTIFYNKIE